MKLITSLIIISSLSFSTFAQDAKAKEILTELSNKAETQKGMKADFTSTLVNKADDFSESREGTIIASGDKYHLYLDDMEVISDGKSVWTILTDAEEVQVDIVPEESETSNINPTKIASMWEEGFYYQYEKETTLNGNTVHLINLFPKDPKEHDFHTVKLYIRKSDTSLEKVVIKGKNGTDIVYEIKTMEVNPTIDANTFNFSASKYPDFEVIDLR